MIATTGQKGVSPIITSRSHTHLVDDVDVFKFQLRERHMVKIDSLHCSMRYDWDPEEVGD